MSQAVSRREMVVLLAAGIAVIGGASPLRLAALPLVPRQAQGDAELTAWIDAQLGRADVASLASAWRSSHPTETSVPALARAIVTGRKPGEPLTAFLVRRVEGEHRVGRAEPVDGWYLAPTEARLATLLDLVRTGTR